MESANSLSATSSKFLRGWCELGRIRSMSISRSWSASLSKSDVPNNAFKPRPNAFLCAMDDLLCQSYVTFGSLGFNIVKQDRTAVTGSFAQPDIAWNDRRKELRAEESAKVLHHLMRQV